MDTNNMTAEEIWDLFQKDKDRLGYELDTVAENDDGRISVAITNDQGDMVIVVNVNGVDEYEDYALSKEECVDMINNIYANYFYYDGNESNEYDDGFAKISKDRQSDLVAATDEFLSIVMNRVLPIATVEEIMEDILEMLSTRKDIAGDCLWRPMILEDDEGNEIRVSYPYMFDV